MKKVPKHITLILSETETVFLLDLPSHTVLKNTEEGYAVEEDNTSYDYLTTGKGRNRNMVTSSTQTYEIIKTTRKTGSEIITSQERGSFASNWVMYDTFNGTPNKETDTNYKNDPDLTKIDKNDEISKLANNPNFFKTVLVIERMLASNCYITQQKRFKGLSDPDIFQLDIKFKYSLTHLWTFSNNYTRHRPVTCISLNPITEDLIAVGYGKFFFTDSNKTGVLMIWNIKNPKQPEREFFFNELVTCLDFSKNNPNLIAVGFYTGQIRIIDISSRDLSIVGSFKASFDAVWDILWFFDVILDKNKVEKILACFKDGQVCKYDIFPSLKAERIQKIEKAEGKLKGIESLAIEGYYISLNRFVENRCLCLNPGSQNQYIIGTNDGCIIHCATDQSGKLLKKIKAHEGPINCIKHSPFVNKIYGTCSDDFRLSFWIDGLDAPFITSKFSLEPVLDFDWSPTHATIFASLRGSKILIWDYRRKIYSPQSQTGSPSGSSYNTKCRFTKSGRCLIVGDTDGNVHVFALGDMPIPAFFQEDLFYQALKTGLVAKPDLLRKLQKLRPFTY